MKGRLVALLDDPDWPRMAALMDDGRLTDLLVDPPEDDAAPRVEAVHMARVTRTAPQLGHAFVDLGDGREGWLKFAKGLRTGAALVVQVVRHAAPGKATPVGAEPLFKGRYAILTPHAPGLNIARRIRDDDERARLRAAAEDALEAADLAGDDAPGLIVRTGAAGVDAGAIEDDIAALAALLAEARAAPERPGLVVAAPDAETLAWREWVDPDPDEVVRGDARLFDDLGALDAIDDLLTPRAPLPGGAWMAVEPTAALVAVDVNTAADASPAAALKANLAAAADLPRQLRLRGLGGQIAIDFAPLAKRDRAKVEAALRRALKADPVDTTVAGWTPLGHLELQRKRERRPLAELLRRR